MSPHEDLVQCFWAALPVILIAVGVVVFLAAYYQAWARRRLTYEILGRCPYMKPNRTRKVRK